MPSVRQTNFSAGELDPKLWGRTDLAKFGAGMRVMRNFFPSRQGAAISRPGTSLVGAAKFGIGSTVNLVEFVFSNTQSYVLEFGGTYVRFISNGGYLSAVLLNYEFPTANFVAGFTVVGVTSGATATVVADINGHATLVLRAVTGTFLAGEDINQGGTVATVYGPPQTAPYELETPYAAGDVSSLQWAQSGDVMTLAHPSYAPLELRRYAHDNWTLTEVTFDVPPAYFQDVGEPRVPTPGPAIVSGTIGAVDAQHPVEEWRWLATVVAQNADGTTFESLPFVVDTQYNGSGNLEGSSSPAPAYLPLAFDRAVTLRRPKTAGLINQPVEWANARVIAFNFYRGRGKLYGFVGQTRSGATNPAGSVVTEERDFVDKGSEPNYAIQPPVGENPFEVYDINDVLLRTEHPAAVAFFQGRLCFGGTTQRPELFLASKLGDFHNFDVHFLQVATDALEFQLASRRRAFIRSYLSLNRLLAFTQSSVWSIGGQEGSPLTFDAPDFQVVEEIGATALPALSVDGCALYVRSKGRGVRALVPANTRSGYNGADISSLAQHLFIRDTVVDWAYAEDPFGVIWACTTSGALLSLTFSANDNMWAWARHDSPAGGSDADALAQVKSIACVPEGDEDAVYLVVQRTSGLYVERMVSRVQQGTVADGKMSLDSSIHYSGAPADTFSGLLHLEGAEVFAVASVLSEDGLRVTQTVYGPFTVDGASITLPEVPPGIAGVLTLDIGLLCVGQLETLDVASAQVRNKQKTTTMVGFEVDQSRGIWAGETLDPAFLVEWPERQDTDGYSGVSSASELVRINLSGKWTEAGRAALELRAPLPVTVLGITREVSIGDN